MLKVLFFSPQSVINTPGNMLYEKRIVSIGFGLVAQCGIKNLAALKFMIPGNRMIAVHFSAGIAGFINLYQDMDFRTYLLKIIPFIGMNPSVRQGVCRQVFMIGDL